MGNGDINRRRFMTKMTAAASTFGVMNKTGGGAGSVSVSQKGHKPEFIIDSHIHCGGTEEWVGEMADIYRAHNAMACVLTWFDDLKIMRDAIKSYPDVFIGYGRVDLDDPKAVREVEKFHENEFVGIKFHSPQKNYDDPSYFHVYRLCEHLGKHMIFHTGISSRRITDEPRWGSSSRMRPMYLDTLCRQFPRTTIQGAHLGNPWYEEAAEAARWNPNLFFDVTGSTLLKFIKLGRLERMSEILWWASDESEDNPHTLKDGPGAWEHIVFGTDESPSGLVPNIERFQMMLDTNNVPVSIRDRMWGLTIAGILGIDPRTRKIMK